MSRRSALSDSTWRWLALASVSALLFVVTLAAVIGTSLPLVPNLYLVPFLAFPAVGALVVARRPHHLVGRLLVVIGGVLAVGSGATVYFWLGLAGHVTAITDLAGWLAAWTYNPVTILIPLVIAVFPSGRLVSGWLRRCLWIGAITVVGMNLVFMVAPLPVNWIFFGDDVINPWGREAFAALAPADDAFMFVVLALIGAAVVDLLLRSRGTRGVERQQVRLAGFGFSVCAVLFAVAAGAELLGHTSQLLWVAALGVGFAALPVSVGLAVARYRLYDIDRLISRTVTYGVVVGVLGAVFATGVLLLGRLLALHGEFAVAASTLAAAALFTPLVRRVRVRVDRRFDRARYDAAQVLEGFGARLRCEVELAALRRELIATATRTMHPTGASLWLPRAPREEAAPPAAPRFGAR